MRIAFRTDASIEIGTGHMMRCLTLAEELRDKGADPAFISRELSGHLCDMAEKKGYRVFRLPGTGADWQQDAQETSQAIVKGGGPVSWLIVDHYGIGRNWEKQLQPLAHRVMVIDDLADRPHDCDVLLDQNLHQDAESRYAGLLPAGCTALLGPGYALLRREFREARRTLRQRDGSVKRILVFLGGSDQSNETAKVIAALQMLNRPDIAVDVVIGSINPHKSKIMQACSDLPLTTCLEQVSNMAELMSNADLAIGAGGTATWERCFLGLPSISIVIADNQGEITETVAAAGATVNLGQAGRTDPSQIAKAVGELIADRSRCTAMGEKAFQIMQRGRTFGAEAVAQELMGENRASS
jgi:UDP-2,4-diacetamido-2,4,6-trideoxy-beta-L-altropyranose hydrolase